ncbi:D-alanyl-D-alanine carboxypeptidase [Candidatus Curtissbacteria bacterium]|nr:D-alanyl-D-alanine carboxypeptidase [Candidatus Curtissbacteria bacterium]
MNFAKITIASFLLFILGILLLSQSIPITTGSKTVNSFVSGLREISSRSQTSPPEIPKLFPYPVPLKDFKVAPPVSGRSAVVIDAKTGLTLFEKDPNIRHLPASTAKLMTAIVALEICDPEQLVRIGYVEPEPAVMGLKTGDLVSIKTLLYGLLMASGNDAAYALSYSCAASTEEFVREMNEKAKELEMRNTNFSNPAGFDSQNQYTTARDLAKLAKVAIASPLIAKIVATRQTVVTDAVNLKTYYLQNINKLLGEVEGIEGIKTGQTEGSLEVLVTQTTRGGNTIIAVVLGSEDRFLDSKQLIEWAFTHYEWINP